MKWFLPAVVVGGLIASSATAQYCSPVHSGLACAVDEAITAVTVGTQTYTSGCVAIPGYENRTSSSFNVLPGAVAPVVVTVANFVSGDAVSVFLDWNGDQDFSDSNEVLPLVLNAGIGST